ncbi:hypothetical protein MHLNE_11000 [Moorella humiferrea]|uniref:hypothetical protein n=1 Tax=Neomoorella humiferrea TaxID=676965 RepID=UPI0030D27BCD
MRTRIILSVIAALILGGGLALYFYFGYPAGRGTAPVPFFGPYPEGKGREIPDAGTRTPAESLPAAPGGGGAEVHPAPGAAAPAPEGSPQPDAPAGLSQGEEQVWQEYAPRLMALQEEYQGRLDALLARAYTDYQRYKNDRAKLLSLAAFYLKEGAALEREADGAFNSIAAAMETELKERHLPLTMVQDLRHRYRDLKQQRRKAIFNRAWDLINSNSQVNFSLEKKEFVS